MQILDLHGERYEKVDRLVENFVLTANLPAKIITGNSNNMRAIVVDVLSRNGLTWAYESFYNLGAIVIYDPI